MKLLIDILNIAVPVAYGLTLLLYGLYFFYSNRSARQYSRPALLITVLIHLVEIILRGYEVGHFPAASIYELASAVALAISLIYIFIETRLNIDTTGFFVLIFPFCFQLISSLFIDVEKSFPEVLKSPMFIVHTTAATLGYTGLFISAFYGGLHLLLFYNLKNARFGNLYRKMPSLQELSNMCFSAAVLGFVLLSITIFQGILWRKIAYPDQPHFDPQIIASYVIWSIYGLYILGKKMGFWSDKRLSYLSLLGFLLIILSVIAVKTVTSFHQFG